MPQNPKQTNIPYIPAYGEQTNLPSPPPYTPPPSPESPTLGQVDGYGGSVLQDITNKFVPDFVKNYGAPGTSIIHSAVSTLSPVLDILSRPNYAVTRFFDSDADVSKSLLQNLQDAGSEFWDPKLRLSFGDLIKKRNPKFAEENPVATTMLGFLADLTFDPATYLGAGLAKSGLRVGGKTLAVDGLKALEWGQKVTSKARFLASTPADVYEILNVEARQAARTGQTTFSPAGHSILKDAGYFDELNNRTNEIIRQFAGQVTQSDAESIAAKEIYSDLRNANYRGVLDPMTNNEVRETVEQRISRLASLNSNDLKLFEPEGFRLKVGLPFGQQYDIKGTQQLFDKLGLNNLAENISNLAYKIRGAKTLNRTFNKYAEFDTLPQEFTDAFRDIENTFDSLTPQLIRDVRPMGVKVPEDRRKFIQETMYNLDDVSRLQEEQLGRTLTVQEAAQLKTDALNAAKLNPDEFAFVSSMYNGYSKMQELEMRANLLHSNIANYTHREYEVLADPNRVTNVLKPPVTNSGTSTFLGSSQARDYLTISEARAAGNVPEMDALNVYAQRMLKSRQKLAVAQFNDTVRSAFNFQGEYGAQLTNKEFNQLPQVVQNSIKSLGDSVYPSTMNNEIKNIIQVMDAGQSIWKRLAYAIKPSSGSKQGVSNTIQMAMVQNAKAFKAFNPLAAVDAGLGLLFRSKQTTALPDFVQKLFQTEFSEDAVTASRLALSNIMGMERVYDFAKDIKIKNSLGLETSMVEHIDNALSGGVIKGFDASGETLKIKISNALKYNPDSIGSVAGELVRPWAWPSLAEDYGRFMGYMNGIRMGYSHNEAVKLVNKGLFDYSRGLSFIEKNVFKRLIPFYTYQRFAIPMVLQNVITQPGNAVTVEKVVKLMDKLFSGTTLTPAEQDTFGSSFPVDQPRVFKGFDKDGKAGFNVLNNLSPFDVLNIFVHDPRTGEIDYRRSVEKSVLAAMTPYLKVPLELLIPSGEGNGKRGYQFFTDKPITQAGRMGNIDKTIGSVIPDFAKKAMGWENRVDQRSGAVSVYVNPYLAYTMTTMVPGLKSYINVGDEDKTPLERGLEILTGINPVKMDLKAQQQINMLKDRKELTRLKSSIRGAVRKDSQTEYDSDRQDYLNLMQLIQQKRSTVGDVRGQGLQNPLSANGQVPTTNVVQTQIFK
jgi:hypothetical protein